MTAAAVDGGARLDAELVRRGLVRSRQRAAELVAEGRVTVAGVAVGKPSRRVHPEDDLQVASTREYVSRAAHKLLGALDAADHLSPGTLDPSGARCLDAGASTGGFTEVLLERGAAQVLAVDVGRDQIAPHLRGDARVTVVEGCNVRDLDALRSAVDDVVPDLVVADLSFISLVLVVEPLAAVVRPGGDMLLMVKPQFEVGRHQLGAGGVVVEPSHQSEAVVGVALACVRTGGRVLAVLPSVLPGEKGNREYFLWVRSRAAGEPVVGGRDDEGVTTGLRAAVDRAVHSGEPVLVGGPEVTS